MKPFRTTATAPGAAQPDTPVKVALAALTTFQGYVQQADAKANTMLVVHTGGVVAAVAALAGRPRHWSPLIDVLLAAFAISFLISGFQILRVLRPTTHAPVPSNPFAISGLGAGVPPDPDKQVEQLWAMARFLGAIALAKNRGLARATPWTALMLCLAVTAAVLA